MLIFISASCLAVKSYTGSQKTPVQSASAESLSSAAETEKTVIEIASEYDEEESAEETAEAPEAPDHYDTLLHLNELYSINPDVIGWLRIDGTVIDYPVMQTLWDENYYLYLDFYGNYDVNGSLLMDTDSEVGVGTAESDYAGGTAPSTNLIIHGHTMRSGAMFGDLDLYSSEDYGKSHSVICFDSLYEHREYELIAAFYSRVFYADEDVFKYYKFFEADTDEGFYYWYDNIKALSLYDTGVTAEPGDEFITLSCCAYHVENGRFAVVGVRTK